MTKANSNDDPATRWGEAPPNAVEAVGLHKTYAASGKQPPKTALHGVDIGVARGAMLGQRGPHRAGE